jgi:hypothetical protein
MVLTLVAAAGCTGTTANPELTPDSVATPTPDKITKITAKYTFGDVVQYDRTDTDYQENVALLIVDVNETHYTYEAVVRDSVAGIWKVSPGYRSSYLHADLEYYCPHYVDWVDTGTVATWTATPTETQTPDTVTTGEKNAVEKAKSYLRFSGFSRSGLIDQLEYEGFSHAEAVYGADHVGANWNEQAAKKAKQYLDYSSFSRSGLIDQLEYEGFTPSQAEYGAKAVGY